MKNKFLKTFSVFLEIFRIIYIAAFALFLAVMVHWHFSPNTYNRVDVSSAFQAGSANASFELKADVNDPSVIPLGSLSYGMAWWLLVRSFLFFVLGLSIIHRIQGITRSIASLQTFYQGNIHHFRKIARLCFIMAFFSFFNFYAAEGDLQFDLGIPFITLLAALGSLLMAGIFKEGMHLAQDKELIV